MPEEPSWDTRTIAIAPASQPEQQAERMDGDGDGDDGNDDLSVAQEPVRDSPDHDGASHDSS